MMSQYGRSFSLLRIPYSLKLLIQELQGMNVQMRIITEENIDQLMSMSFSDNIIKVTDQELKLVQTAPAKDSTVDPVVEYISRYKNAVTKIQTKAYQTPVKSLRKKETTEEEESSPESVEQELSSSSPPFVNAEYPKGPGYDAYKPESGEIDSNQMSEKGSPASYNPNKTSTPEMQMVKKIYSPSSPTESPPPELVKFGDEELEDFFSKMPIGSQKQIRSLPLRDQIMVLKNSMAKKKTAESILNVPEEDSSKEKEKEKDKDNEREKESGEESENNASKEENKGDEVKSGGGGGGSGTKTVSFG